MTISVRRLNTVGTQGFADFIDRIRCGEASPAPFYLLDDDRYSETLSQNIIIGQTVFATRYDMGRHLCEAFRDCNMQPLLGDDGFWNWIALLWFDQLCPPSANGRRSASQKYNYILSTNYNHRPRHAIRTTWMLVDKHDKNSLFLLSKSPEQRGELIEQIAARQFLINCKGVVAAASRLYFDQARQTFRRGSTSRKRKGNIRRFINYLQQLELNYDLYSMPGEQIVDILPDEYSSFLNAK